MTNAPLNSLLEAFREDHLVLGGGFHHLAVHLRAGQIASAIAAARHLDQEGGAHIAFEEDDFYPAIATLIGRDEVESMYAQHRLGVGVVNELRDLADDALLEPQIRDRLIADAETMSDHIAECGELFETIGRLTPADQHALLERLEWWRRLRPRWSAYAAMTPRRHGRLMHRGSR
jgi:hypothetical protein